MGLNTSKGEYSITALRVPFSYFIEKIKERNRKGYNNVIVFVGEPGVGKSYSALSLCMMLDPQFNEDKIVFRVSEFLRKVRELQGGCLLWDDAGTGISHRDFQSVTNKAFSYVTQMVRFKLINLIITVPYFYWIDKVGRILTKFLVRMLDRGIGLVYELSYNPILGWRTIKSREIVTFPNPRDIDPNLVEKYEEKKRKYFDWLCKREEERARRYEEEIEED